MCILASLLEEMVVAKSFYPGDWVQQYPAGAAHWRYIVGTKVLRPMITRPPWLLVIRKSGGTACPRLVVASTFLGNQEAEQNDARRMRPTTLASCCGYPCQRRRLVPSQHLVQDVAGQQLEQTLNAQNGEAVP